MLIYNCETQSETTKVGDNMKKLNRLKGRIKEKQLTYSALAKMLGISLSALNNKINGRSTFDIIEASEISSVLDISPQDIIYFFT